MTDAVQLGGDVVWWPTDEIAANSNLARFMAVFGVQNLRDLQRRSIDEPERFWSAVLADLDIRFHEPYSRILDVSAGVEWPRWCIDGRLNIVDNCIDKRRDDARSAIKWEGEEGSTRELSYRELAQDVCRAANALRRLGLAKGDVVALDMPMLPETAIALFAIARIGAIVLPLFSGYGAEALTTRLDDAGAVCVITCDGYQRRGRTIALKNVVDLAVARSPAVRHVVVVRRSGIDVDWRAGRDRWWSDIVGNESTQCESERTSAEDPLMLLYSLGHDRPPEGDCSHALRLPCQSCTGLITRFRLEAAGYDFLGHRHRLDDGSVGAIRRNDYRRKHCAL